MLSEPKRSKIAAFLNSPFGIWLLSTIVISVAGGLLTRYERVRAQHEEQTTRTAKLDIEISYRLSNMLLQLRALQQQQTQNMVFIRNARLEPALFVQLRDEYAVNAREANRRVFERLWRPPNDDQPLLYPDYARDSPLMLMARLRAELRNEHEIAQLDVVMARISAQETTTSESAAAVAAEILENLTLPRWKRTFRLTTCTAQAPFC